MNKRYALLLTLVCVFVLAFGLLGCGKASIGVTDDGAIRAVVDEELTLLQNDDEKELNQFLDDVASEDLQTLQREYGVDCVDLLSHVFRGFKYSIDQVVIDGEKATAKLSVTSLDVSIAMAEASELAQQDEHAQAIASLYSSNEADAKSKLVNYVLQLVYEALDGTNDLITRETELKLVKQNGEWAIDAGSLAELLDVVFGSLDPKSL